VRHYEKMMMVIGL